MPDYERFWKRFQKLCLWGETDIYQKIHCGTVYEMINNNITAFAAFYRGRKQLNWVNKFRGKLNWWLKCVKVRWDWKQRTFGCLNISVVRMNDLNLMKVTFYVYVFLYDCVCLRVCAFAFALQKLITKYPFKYTLILWFHLKLGWKFYYSWTAKFNTAIQKALSLFNCVPFSHGILPEHLLYLDFALLYIVWSSSSRHSFFLSSFEFHKTMEKQAMWKKLQQLREQGLRITLI